MNIPDILNYLCVIITVDITLITQNTKYHFYFSFPNLSVCFFVIYFTGSI